MNSRVIKSYKHLSWAREMLFETEKCTQMKSSDKLPIWNSIGTRIGAWTATCSFLPAASSFCCQNPIELFFPSCVRHVLDSLFVQNKRLLNQYLAVKMSETNGIEAGTKKEGEPKKISREEKLREAKIEEQVRKFYFWKKSLCVRQNAMRLFLVFVVGFFLPSNSSTTSNCDALRVRWRLIRGYF